MYSCTIRFYPSTINLIISTLSPNQESVLHLRCSAMLVVPEYCLHILVDERDYKVPVVSHSSLYLDDPFKDDIVLTKCRFENMVLETLLFTDYQAIITSPEDDLQDGCFRIV